MATRREKHKAELEPEISDGPVVDLLDYGSISIAYDITRVLEPVPMGKGLVGISLRERPVEAPWRKDYDAIPGNSPSGWAQQFDVSRWGMLVARVRGERVGGAVIAFQSPGVLMLEGRSDLAVLWDLRVAATCRRRGLGATLFRAAEAWASTRDCRQLKVETQNTNVDACRFYARQGCSLGAIDRFAYPGHPNEVQLLWYKDLSSISSNPSP